MKIIPEIVKIYNAAALMLLNIIVGFVLINLILFIGFETKDRFFTSQNSNPVAAKYSSPALKKVYPQLAEDEINDLLSETWSRPYLYETFTLFKEAPYKGHYVNVDNAGFRITKNQGPWPPEARNLNIFLFGGSTTFGYGLPDNQTIASYLQEYMEKKLEQTVCVYNFGRGSYYSQQERILFEKLLIAGFIPDLAVFIDGFNDFYLLDNRPAFSDRFEHFFIERKQAGESGNLEFKLIGSLPLARFAKFISHKLQVYQNGADNIYFKENVVTDKNQNINISEVEKVIERYLENKKIIEAAARAYGVNVFFVWQPVSSFRYDLKHHLFASASPIDEYLNYGYKNMDEIVNNNFMGNNFLWAADMQKDMQKALYIDKVHYSAEMSEALAVQIGQHLLQDIYLKQN